MSLYSARPTAKVKRGNTYKLAYRANRHDAKRHLIRSFQEEDRDAAIMAVDNLVVALRTLPENKNKTFELYTGNWKLVKEYKNTMED